ncbi:MAG: DsrE family protein [Acidiferrobacteraceae bacterium]
MAEFTKTPSTLESKRVRPAYPVIPDYGPAYSIPGAFEVPERGREAHAMFDVTHAIEASTEVHPGLMRVARYLNLYGAVGVDPRLIHVVVVLHGPATAVVLRDEAYRKVRHVDCHNPNLALINTLHDAGVMLYVCGQSMRDAGFDDGDIAPDVRLAYSALALASRYQERHYAYFPV